MTLTLHRNLDAARDGQVPLETPEAYWVRSGGWTCGSIQYIRSTGGMTRWEWRMSGTITSVEGSPIPAQGGGANTREEAMEVFRKNFERWLAWAGLREL